MHRLIVRVSSAQSERIVGIFSGANEDELRRKLMRKIETARRISDARIGSVLRVEDCLRGDGWVNR